MQTPPPEEDYTILDDSESDEGDDEDMELDDDDDDSQVPSPVTGPRLFTPVTALPTTRSNPTAYTLSTQHFTFPQYPSAPISLCRIPFWANSWRCPGLCAHAHVACRATRCNVREVKIIRSSSTDPGEGSCRETRFTFVVGNIGR